MARSRVQSIRSNVSGARPASQEPGTIYTNFADLQIGVADTARQPKDLVAVRYFATTASYTPGQLVVQNGKVYRATVVISPGAFDPTKWQEITVQSGSGIWVGDSPRAEAPVQGQLLWESDSGDLFVWYEDADSGQWVQINVVGPEGGDETTFTGILNGDGAGNGTNIGPELQALIDKVSGEGGGAIKIPVSGTGIARWSTTVNGKANVVIQADPNVLFDMVGGGRYKVDGSVGPEIALASPAGYQRGRVITTAVPHGLAARDYVYFHSQRVAFNLTDAGLDWWLGQPTAGVTGVYFGEVAQVQSVGSDTQFTIASDLVFPDYLQNKLSETDPNARNAATIQKINFVKGAGWIGGRFTETSAAESTLLQFTWCYRPIVKDVEEVWFGTTYGHSVHVANCFEPRVANVKTRRDPNYSEEPNHSNYNSYIEAGCWYADWRDIYDENGSQGLDLSWNNLGHPGMFSRAEGISTVGNKMGGWTTHSGHWRASVVDPRIIGSKYPISNRGRFTLIENPVLIASDPANTLLEGIQIFASGRDLTVRGGRISGFYQGITSYGTELGVQGPRQRNLAIDGVSFDGNTRAIHVVTSNPSRATTEDSGVSITNCQFSNSIDFGIFLNEYANGVLVAANWFGPMGAGASRRAIFSSSNTVRSRFIGNDFDRIGAGATGIYLGTISDTTTFPPASYPSPLFLVHGNTFNGPGTRHNFIAPRNAANHLVGPQGGTALAADLNAATTLVLENNSSNYLQFIASAAGTNGIRFGSLADTDMASLLHQQSNNWLRLKVNGAQAWDWIANGNLQPATDNTLWLGQASNRVLHGYITNLRPGPGLVTWTSGAGSPAGTVTATQGSLYTRSDGGAGTTLYVKESGGNDTTGWVAK